MSVAARDVSFKRQNTVEAFIDKGLEHDYLEN
jgi:hypothetical protein